MIYHLQTAAAIMALEDLSQMLLAMVIIAYGLLFYYSYAAAPALIRRTDAETVSLGIWVAIV